LRWEGSTGESWGEHSRREIVMGVMIEEELIAAIRSVKVFYIPWVFDVVVGDREIFW